MGLQRVGHDWTTEHKHRLQIRAHPEVLGVRTSAHELAEVGGMVILFCQRSLAGYNPRGHKKLVTTERLTLPHFSCYGIWALGCTGFSSDGTWVHYL